MAARYFVLLVLICVVQSAPYQKCVDMEKSYSEATKEKTLNWKIGQDGAYYDCIESRLVQILLDSNSTDFYFSNQGKVDKLKKEVITFGRIDENFERVKWNYTVSIDRFDGDFVFHEETQMLVFLYKPDKTLEKYFIAFDSQSGRVVGSFHCTFQHSDGLIYDINTYNSSLNFLVRSEGFLQKGKLIFSLSRFECVLLNDINLLDFTEIRLSYGVIYSSIDIKQTFPKMIMAEVTYPDAIQLKSIQFLYEFTNIPSTLFYARNNNYGAILISFVDSPYFFINTYYLNAKLSDSDWQQFNVTDRIQQINSIQMKDKSDTVLILYTKISSNVEYSCIARYYYSVESFCNQYYFKDILIVDSRVFAFGSKDFQLSRSSILNVNIPEYNILIFENSLVGAPNRFNGYETDLEILTKSYTSKTSNGSIFKDENTSKGVSENWKTFHFTINQSGSDYILNQNKKINTFDPNFFCFLNDTGVDDYSANIDLFYEYNGTSLTNFDQSVETNTKGFMNIDDKESSFGLDAMLYKGDTNIVNYTNFWSILLCDMDEGDKCNPYKNNYGGKG